jgi:uncharacterized protein (DUF488 family)
VKAHQLRVWTIGHSTHTAEQFRSILTAHGIELIVDVRRFPGSRRLPHFSSERLEADLSKAGILYRWIPELGGRRRATGSTSTSAWRNASFQAYAEHVATEEFATGLEELMMLAHGARTAIMCAEILWWRCHRRIIADVMTVLDVAVLHVRDDSEPELHRLSPPARLIHGTLSYSAVRS